MCLISISSSGMQQLLNVCHSFSIEHSLLYNGTKSYSLCFKPNSIKFERPGFYLGKMLIPKVTQCKYLGVIISDSDIDDISIPVQFIIDQNLLSLGIACLILFLPLIIITEHLQIFVTVHGRLVVWTCANIFRTK